MEKKSELLASMEQQEAAGSEVTGVVKRLLTEAEWDEVAGGDGHAQNGNYTQTTGDFAQTGGGSHGQTGGGSYSMTVKPPYTFDPE